MLYVTTREKFDAFTAARTLTSDRGMDGGLYLPYRMPKLSAVELQAMGELPIGERIAQILNLFFGKNLSGRDVEFAIGRHPVKTTPFGQKMVAVECWRNLDGSYSKMEQRLAARICGCPLDSVFVSSWLRQGIRIALLVAVLAQTVDGQADETVDIAVAEKDFSLAAAVWYARQMGLPIGKIVIGCGSDSGLWDLLHSAQRRGSNAPELERVIFGAFGFEENQRFVSCQEQGSAYTLLAQHRQQLSEDLYAAVVSQERMNTAIPNVFRTTGYVLSAEGAIAYSALQDYRARTGESRRALILCDHNPMDAAEQITGALKISTEQLKEILG